MKQNTNGCLFLLRTATEKNETNQNKQKIYLCIFRQYGKSEAKDKPGSSLWTFSCLTAMFLGAQASVCMGDKRHGHHSGHCTLLPADSVTLAWGRCTWGSSSAAAQVFPSATPPPSKQAAARVALQGTNSDAHNWLPAFLGSYTSFWFYVPAAQVQPTPVALWI